MAVYARCKELYRILTTQNLLIRYAESEENNGTIVFVIGPLLLKDPAVVVGPEEQRLDVFRHVGDQIRDYLREFTITLA